MSAETQNFLQFAQSRKVLREALSASAVADLNMDGWAGVTAQLMPNAVSCPVDPSDKNNVRETIAALKDGQSCILMRNILPYLSDYRGAIAAAFEKLRIGGFLVIAVPHQFLYERKLQPPSRRNGKTLRFYTPAALLTEVEEALDPCQYRTRDLSENDLGFDYKTPLRNTPPGGQHIVLCLERIAAPDWRNELEAAESQTVVTTKATRFAPFVEDEQKLYRLVAPDTKGIDRILAIKLDHRGDFIMAEDAFRILRQAFPAASITLVCGSWNVAAARGFGIFDDIIPFDFFPEDASLGYTGPSRAELGETFCRQMASAEFDLAIDFRLYEDSRQILYGMKARQKAAFDRHNAFPWLTIQLNVPSPTEDGRVEQGIIQAKEFDRIPGRLSDQENASARRWRLRKKGAYVWGPYQRLNPGQYEFELLTESLGKEVELQYDLVVMQDKTTIASGNVLATPGKNPRLKLHLPAPADGFEFRLAAKDNGTMPPFHLRGLRYWRVGNFTGVHQREAMMMLAYLIPVRLQDAYRVTVS